MSAWRAKILFGAMVAVLAVEPAAAHHVMGGRMPQSFWQGLLSGLGHPIIGIDHLAAIIAVGCLAAGLRGGPLLAFGFVVAMISGAALHAAAVSVAGVEAMVAASVLALGVALLLRRHIPVAGSLAMFVAAGAVHGYALGESIVGAEPAPFYAYFIGLALIQTAIAFAAIAAVRAWTAGAVSREEAVRFAAAVIIGVGLSNVVQQIVPA